MMKLIVVVLLAVAAYVAYKLKTSGKVVTPETVVEGVKAEAQVAADAVNADITKK